MDTGGTFLSYRSLADYQAAIAAAPPNTLIKLGDLEKQVQCSTCGAWMDPAATQFHKHPKKCDGCGVEFDENMVRHVPVHQTRHVGAGTITTSPGCKVEAL